MTPRAVLAVADELAAHLWRIPLDEHAAYKRVMQLLLGTITGVRV